MSEFPYNEKQKALMYDVLIKLESFRSQVAEYIEDPPEHRITPMIDHSMRGDDDGNVEMAYDIYLDLDLRYAFAILWIFAPDKNGESVMVCHFNGEKFDEGVRMTLDELSKLLDESVDKVVKFANKTARVFKE